MSDCNEFPSLTEILGGEVLPHFIEWSAVKNRIPPHKKKAVILSAAAPPPSHLLLQPRLPPAARPRVRQLVQAAPQQRRGAGQLRGGVDRQGAEVGQQPLAEEVLDGDVAQHCRAEHVLPEPCGGGQLKPRLFSVATTFFLCVSECPGDKRIRI